MNKLHFVTSNKNKARDAQEILGFPLEIVQLELLEIQSMDLEVIVMHKADEAFKILKKPLIVDDVGLFIDAWNGFPGPFVKFIGKNSYNQLLRMLSSEINRKAYAKVAIGYHDGEKIHTFFGQMDGEIAFEERGESG